MQSPASSANPPGPSAQDRLAGILAHLEERIPALPLTGHPAELYEPMRYIMALGGKRFRPQLVVLAAGLFGEDKARLPEVTAAALAVEIFHNFSLMHDDIMDRAPLRRGKPTVHERWSEPVAILSGDGMLVKAYEVLLAMPPALLAEVLANFNRCALEVVEGQQLDMNYEQARHLSEADYLEMIRLKTAALVGFSLWLGARLGGATPAEAEALRQAGEQMGVGFQLFDDYLDAYGDPAQVGKTPGGDILAGKHTYLVVQALTALPPAEQARLEAIYHNPPPGLAPEEKIAQVMALFAQAQAGPACQALSERYYAKGLAAVQGMGLDAAYTEAIVYLGEMLMKRER